MREKIVTSNVSENVSDKIAENKKSGNIRACSTTHEALKIKDS